MKWVRAITLTAATVALGAVAACGSQGTPVSGAALVDQADQVEAGAPEAQAAPQANAAGVQATKLAATDAGDLGQVVVDGEGRTVYRFDNDTGKPSKSNCDGDCVTAWPPLLADDPASLQVDGIDRTLIGVVGRTDGSQQVTIAGWPAYRYSQDAAPGDVKGQGAGGKWFAFAPTGKKAASAAAAAQTVQLVLMKVGNLGPIVTDAAGMTLYRFDRDTAKPTSKSNCDGECAAKWPPLLVPDGAQFQLTGIDEANVGTVTRSDGSQQVTVGGWPMYYFAGDKEPCDINGQGVDNVWFATKADGKKAGV